MANLATASVQLSNPFPLSSSSKSLLRRPFLLFTTRATEPQTPPSDSDPSEPTATGEDFDDRINQLRIRYKRGTGKKAEIRKSKKSNKAASGSGPGSGVYLPPVPLKEPVSGGLKVELGFSRYSERLNGRIALLGLTALLLVELATGKGLEITGWEQKLRLILKHIGLRIQRVGLCWHRVLSTIPNSLSKQQPLSHRLRHFWKCP
ncbi:hypothetical protein MtrunA17_Chr1g0213101 [Medicago truncatula]|uniref:Uncharacterized protein n=1 Tax=Medicago truncatula TaxID=3880 RepID=A0A396KCA7_MEDTR|nr:hypothetical protein MtrunA17_Chr1g0213101 [Medicago truncatula]